MQAEYQTDPKTIEISEPFVSFTAKKKENPFDFQTLTQASTLNRSFLTQGDVISVFTMEKDAIDHLIPLIKSFENLQVTPSKLLLHEQDTKMLLLDEKNPQKVFYVDLETGKVVQELQPDPYNKITDISLENKGQTTPSPVFLGMNEKNLFKMDPRVKGGENAIAKKVYAFHSTLKNVEKAVPRVLKLLPN